MTDSYRQAYKEEAFELLSELETTLLLLESSPQDMELINRVFRALHTIKGSGSMFGFDNIAEFVHDLESVYDMIRDGKLQVTKELIGLSLKAKDEIRCMLEEDNHANGVSLNEGEKEEVSRLRGAIAAQLNAAPSCVNAPAPAELPDEGIVAGPRSVEKEGDGAPARIYRIHFTPQENIFLNGTNPLFIFDELSLLGECRVVAQLAGIPDLDSINPELCCVAWDILLTTDQGTNAIEDAFEFVYGQCELRIEVIGSESIDDPVGQRKLGEILIERGDISDGELKGVLAEKKFIGEMLIEKGLVGPDKVVSALAEQQYVKNVIEQGQKKDETVSSIRVSADKLDLLVNLVGQLVTVQARLSQTVPKFRSPELNGIAEEVERLTADLRDNTLNIRMLPIGATFGRFKRLVRDLSIELGKEIEILTDGAETELDKTVIERLNDPLVHLIRNCIDHGIESPDTRESMGKERKGTIRLSAAHSGGNVVITIEDDGRGLSRDEIIKKAVEKGLLHKTELTDKEVFNFIFYPGFSTAKEITNLSGRGVGMDVVKRAIESLRGSIDIFSVINAGTTVTIKLPLTLAIVEGLLVDVADRHFVLPLSAVEECVEITDKERSEAHGRNLANIRGELVPYVRLRKEFEIPGMPPKREQIVITGTNGDKVGFAVDRVVGSCQTVIKNLGKIYSRVEGVSGATILGDGTVALIVDVPKVIYNAIKGENEEMSQKAMLS